MKMKKVISILLVVLSICAILSACDNNKQQEEKKEYTTRSKTVSYVHFNTVSTLSSYGDTTAEEFDGYVKTVDEMLGYEPQKFVK